LLQNTFQSSMPLLNAFFGIMRREDIMADLFGQIRLEFLLSASRGPEVANAGSLMPGNR